MEETMIDLKKRAPEIAIKVREISKHPGGEFFDLKNFFQEKHDDGYSVGFNGTNSRIDVDKDGVIHAKSGGIENDNVDQLNEFINCITQLPNRKIIVNDTVEYCTDSEGRVIEATANRTAMKNSTKKINSTRDSNTQKRVKIDLNGNKLEGYDAGHIFSNSTNGCNNTINQVPMPSKYNRGGEWRELEHKEETWLEEGEPLVTTRKIIYKEPGSKVVKSIITTNIVNGKTMPDVIVNFLITKN